MNYHFSDDFLPEEEKQEIRDLICLPDYKLLKKLQEMEMKISFNEINPDPNPDNVYEVAAVSIGVTAAESKTGAGLTAVAQVTVSVANLEGLSGLGYSGFYGNFSWGKVLFGNRATPQAYNAYTNDGITGISTGGILRRLYPLAGSGYTS